MSDKGLRGQHLDIRVGDSAAASRRKPTRIRTVYVRRKAFDDTLCSLRLAAPREGYLVWTGRISNGEDAVIQTAFPFSGYATKRYAEANGRDLDRLRQHLLQAGDFVFTQVHSHAGVAFHSPTDNIHAFSLKRGFFSIVVPDFGRAQMKDLTGCAVYELADKWQRLSDDEVLRRFVLIE
ncbi:MAG TPA: hypothetical protein VGL40_05995 [Bacillota bacterium]